MRVLLCSNSLDFAAFHAERRTCQSGCAAMGVSLSTVNRAHMAYDHGGLETLQPRPSGGRKPENMTLEEEKALLARFAQAAGAGEMLNIHDLKAAYEKAIGHRQMPQASCCRGILLTKPRAVS